MDRSLPAFILATFAVVMFGNSLAMFVDDSLRPTQPEELPQTLLPQTSKVSSSLATFRTTFAKT